VDKNGGLDPFILKAKDSVLSPKALRLKRAIAKKAAAKAA
jgi:large subunit ribosomal protein L28